MNPYPNSPIGNTNYYLNAFVYLNSYRFEYNPNAKLAKFTLNFKDFSIPFANFASTQVSSNIITGVIAPIGQSNNSTVVYDKIMYSSNYGNNEPNTRSYLSITIQNSNLYLTIANPWYTIYSPSNFNSTSVSFIYSYSAS